MEYQVEQIHCGQYKPYGDFFRVWNIKTGATLEDTTAYCFSKIYQRRVPESSEWHKNIRYGTGAHSGDANYYFAGYYEIKHVDGGWLFTVCEPFAD